MTSEHEEGTQETYLQQLQRHAQAYVTWASRLGSSVTPEQEAQMQAQARLDSNNMWEEIDRNGVPEEDKKCLEEIAAAVEELDGSLEGTKTFMERVTAAFESASEWTQQNIGEPLCNFFKSLYESACKVCNQIGEKLGFFSNAEGDTSTDNKEDLGHDGPAPGSQGSEQ